MRRKRFQKGSLQHRKHGRHRVWVAFWWEDGIRRCKTLGRQSQMSKSEAEAVLCAILRDINSRTPHLTKEVYTFAQFTNEVYLPLRHCDIEGQLSGNQARTVTTVSEVANRIQDYL